MSGEKNGKKIREALERTANRIVTHDKKPRREAERIARDAYVRQEKIREESGR